MADYELMAAQVKGFAESESDFVPLLSNVSAILWEGIDRINWAGFYLMDRGSLLLGPFQGKYACIRIDVGSGVCGTAVAEDKTQVVRDVHEFPGHIACDVASNSEVVVPLHSDGKIVGVLDIDSPEPSRFTEDDARGLEKITEVIEQLCDFSRLR